MNDFLKRECALQLPRSLVTRLGVCIQNKSERKLDSLRAFYYDILLLTTAYAVHFWGGQFPDMELMLLLLCPLFFIEMLYFLQVKKAYFMSWNLCEDCQAFFELQISRIEKCHRYYECE